MALKRQQAVEDAIALKLASNETGKELESLPPGKIFGMNVTEPCITSSPPAIPISISQPTPSTVEKFSDSDKSSKYYQIKFIIKENREIHSNSFNLYVKHSISVTTKSNISQNAIDMLAHLFPHRKRSVLELILRRCDLDLLRAIEHCGNTSTKSHNLTTITASSMSAFRPPTMQVNKQSIISLSFHFQNIKT